MSHTTKPGKPEILPEDNIYAEDTNRGNRSVPWIIILLGVLALLLATVIGTQVIGVLYVMIFPPMPPLPGNVTLLSHTSDEYGVDAWLYTSSQHVCDVVNFYVSIGDNCQLASIPCGANTGEDTSATPATTPDQLGARCYGDVKASIFAMRWQAIIAVGSTPDIPTQFRLTREMFWTGELPPPQLPEMP